MARPASIGAAALLIATAVLGCGSAAADTPTGQSAVFFPGAPDTYWVPADQTDRDHLTELGALRRIDACGFVDPRVLTEAGHPDFSYGRSAARWIEPGMRGQVAPISPEACLIALPDNPLGVQLAVRAGESTATDDQFHPDPAHPVPTRRSAPCQARVPLPLAGMTGAPAGMRDPVLEVSLAAVRYDQTPRGDDPLCALVGSVADAAAAAVRDSGVPAYSGDSRLARFATADPCAAARDVAAVGFIWWEPRPAAQVPATGRHPSVCDLRTGGAAGDPAAPTAVIKYGLVNWSDEATRDPSGQTPQRTERGGVTLYSYPAPGCRVVARAGSTIAPTVVGNGAGLAAATPVATVALSGPADDSCLLTAERAALAALGRAVS